MLRWLWNEIRWRLFLRKLDSSGMMTLCVCEHCNGRGCDECQFVLDGETGHPVSVASQKAKAEARNGAA